MHSTIYRPVAIYIAWRYLRARAGSHFISFTSLISVLGLMLGVAVLIVVLSVMNGFHRELQNRILGLIPHTIVRGYEPIEEWQILGNTLSQQDGVVAVAPWNQIQGMLVAGGVTNGVLMTGIDPSLEPQVSVINQFLPQEILQKIQPGQFNVILGRGLADQLNLDVGEYVTFIIPEAALTPAGVIPRFKRFKVVGLFSAGTELDYLLSYIHWQDAARLLRHPNQVQGVRLRFEDVFMAPQLAYEILQKLPSSAYYTSDWTDTHGNLFAATQMEKTMMTLLLLLVVAVAAFNIIASLVMLVTEKRGAIAILRTLGATPAIIQWIFISQGILIGAVGIFAGVLLGVGLTAVVSDFVQWLQHLMGRELLSVYFIHFLPTELLWQDVVLIAGVAFLLTVLATIYPALQAAKTIPAEVLRHE